MSLLSLPHPAPPALPSWFPSSPDLQIAREALRPLRAWLGQRSVDGAERGQTALSDSEAAAVCRVLYRAPATLSLHSREALIASRVVLAARAPGKRLTLTVDQARQFDLAMAGLESQRTASASDTEIAT